MPLKQIQAGREYGVRAIVDLAKRSTKVFVDGKLLAADIPLLSQVENLDYVLIETGSEAVGQLFLPVMNVHIGYAVNESFLVAGRGSLPDDWRRASDTGNVSVEPFQIVQGNPVRPAGDTRRIDKRHLKDPQLAAWYREWQGSGE